MITVRSRRAGRRPSRLAPYDLVSFQNRMITVGSSVPGIPFPLVLETAIIFPCQTGMIDASLAASAWIDRRTPVRILSFLAPSSALISFSIVGLLYPFDVNVSER